MKVSYRQAASDDMVRQFRFYLVTLDLPEVAVRFREAVRLTVDFLREHPQIGQRYTTSDSRGENLRTWPITGFEATRIYYQVDKNAIRIVRILHGKRDVAYLLRRDT